jgi:hypothetical protein
MGERHPCGPVAQAPERRAWQARFFSLGLRCRLVLPSEVAEWAEVVFRREAAPPAWAVDLAFSGRPNARALLPGLDAVGGRKYSDSDLRRVLVRIESWIDQGVLTPRTLLTSMALMLRHALPELRLARRLREEGRRLVGRAQRNGEPSQAMATFRRWLRRLRDEAMSAA